MSEHNDPVNLGNPDEISVLNLAKEIIALSGSKSKILNKPLPEDDPKVRQPDISIARMLLKWEPKIPRTLGLKKTLEYFRAKLTPTAHAT
jgi:dTDP-glucose 4,6-dehydratase